MTRKKALITGISGLAGKHLADLLADKNFDIYGIDIKKNKEKRIAEKLSQQLAKISVTIPVKTGEEDKVFGAVTTLTIANLLKEQKFDIDRKKIQLDEPIKALGVYTIPIKLHPEVEGHVKIWIVKE